MGWYYYDANGIKQGQIDDVKLKTLALNGIIKPDTLIENDKGTAASASRIKGLVFKVSSDAAHSTDNVKKESYVLTRRERAYRTAVWVSVPTFFITILPIIFLMRYFVNTEMYPFLDIASGFLCTLLLSALVFKIVELIINIFPDNRQ
jgi:hypothetical protein